LVQFDYERGEGRIKHRWDRDEAGFRSINGEQVGKCHRSISETIARGLLRSGFVEASPYDDGTPGTAPDEIFNVYRGVPYVAVTTSTGKSYHGYPWSGRMSATIREELRARALQEGTVKVFNRWLKTYRKG
jgi:hypothetical protein